MSRAERLLDDLAVAVLVGDRPEIRRLDASLATLGVARPGVAGELDAHQDDNEVSAAKLWALGRVGGMGRVRRALAKLRYRTRFVARALMSGAVGRLR